MSNKTVIMHPLPDNCWSCPCYGETTSLCRISNMYTGQYSDYRNPDCELIGIRTGA